MIRQSSTKSSSPGVLPVKTGETMIMLEGETEGEVQDSVLRPLLGCRGQREEVAGHGGGEPGTQHKAEAEDPAGLEPGHQADGRRVLGHSPVRSAGGPSDRRQVSPGLLPDSPAERLAGQAPA